ncbi:hypothetical protein [Planomonospora algeriensis]
MAGETIEYCRGLAADAVAALPPIADPEAAAALHGLPSACLDRAKSLLVR